MTPSSSRYCPDTAFALREGLNVLCLDHDRLAPFSWPDLAARLARLLPEEAPRFILTAPGDVALADHALFCVPPDNPAVLAACARMAAVCLVPGDTAPGHALLELCSGLGVPVIALGQAPALAKRAVILEQVDPAHAAALIAALVRNRSLARAAAPVKQFGLEYLVDGPHEGSYSLSLLNRELALALERLAPGRVGLDFLCRPEGQDRSGRGGGLPDPLLEKMRQRAESTQAVRAVLWNSYPPHVFSRPGALSLTGGYGWEESLFPRAFVERFNRRLDAMTVMSAYVRKVMIDNGVRLPVHVVGLGVDHVQRAPREPLDMDLGRSFRFLHVSSCFPRKGVDLLLAAHARAFTDRDDVTLVVKCFPNPHNTVPEQIAALRAKRPDCPDIVLINQDLNEGRLKDLYLRCHALVAPSRGEGFGLPMAEAMLLGLPVITTGYGGQADFCTPDNAWLIDWDFAQSRTHLNRFGSVWAEPRIDHLTRLLREVFQAGPQQLRPRLDAARATASGLTWEACARKVAQAAADAAAAAEQPVSQGALPVAWISTWNSACGIAKYSEYLCARLDPDLAVFHLAPVWENRLGPDQPSVSRCFGHEDFAATLPGMIRDLGCRAVVIQFHFSFFNLPGLARLLRELRDLEVRTVVVFHATAGPNSPLARIAPDLALADRLLAHTVADMNLFKDLGLADRAVFFPHGVPDRPASAPRTARARQGLPGRIIAGFGFLMPHKGILELIQAFAPLAATDPDLRLLLLCARYPKPASHALHGECLERISGLGLADRVSLVTAFLPDEQVLDLLAAAELVVFPYQHTRESSSAAVRFGLAARRPVVCAPLPIFDDVAEVVHFLPGTTPEHIGQGLKALLDDPERAASTLDLQNQWIAAHSWQTTARRLSGMLHALHAQREPSGMR